MNATIQGSSGVANTTDVSDDLVGQALERDACHTESGAHTADHPGDQEAHDQTADERQDSGDAVW